VRIRLLSVGKPRETLCAGLHDEYAGRLVKLGVSYLADCVGEVRPGGRYSDDHVREREARALLAALDDKQTVVALDERGELFDSRRLAQALERWATPRATLIVGGSIGLHGSVLDRADHGWSLSRLTFPHELARALVAEQLYRAVTLLRGIPYHK
jgi:23S rRNA (pseudouridine1915-N3)-methyltransferase